MDIKNTFGKNVRLTREKLGWSQEELAEFSGYHRTYISGIERGRRNPTISVSQNIAKALAVPLHKLLCEVKRENSK